MRTITLILGSVREGRNGEHVWNAIKKAVADRKDMHFEFADLKDWNLPLSLPKTTPSMAGGKYDDPEVQKWAGVIARSDGYVWVTPEYNHSTSAAMKNAIDHLYPEWKHKPVALISYGAAAGGVRAAEHLRQVASELHMASTRETMYIGLWSDFDLEKGVPKDADRFSKRVNQIMDDLAWWTETLAKGREASQ